jgi:crotonobetainyl-CoA:carnitine CoA-transferase CaiB-like acyl-CoA transferase
VLAGPYCTQVLADLGAEVWKVEPPTGDDTRAWGPPFVGEDAAYFFAANRGKRSIAVDLKTPAGAAVVADLAAQADVVVENFKVGDLARFGLAYDQVRERNPAVVFVSITGYGQTGPRATEPGYDLVMQAMTGLLAMTGPSDGSPARVGVALIDVLTGMHAVTATLAALRQRDATGEGQHIDLALFDVGLASMANVGQAALVTGASPRRHGSAHPSIVPYQAFATAAGDVVIAVGNDGQFARLCAVLGMPELADDPRFVTNPDRVTNRDELVDLLAERLATRPASDWVEALAAAGVPVSPVLDVARALDDPQTHHRGLRWGVDGPAGPMELLGSPLGALAGAARDRPPPRLGADTRDVLAEVLGMAQHEIDRLRSDGVVVGD